jgi:hypothetical protein
MKIYKVYYCITCEGVFDDSYFLNKDDAEKASMDYSGNKYKVEEIEVNEQYTSN